MGAMSSDLSLHFSLSCSQRINGPDVPVHESQQIVFEDHIEIKLKAEIDELLRTGTIANINLEESEEAAIFDSDTENIERASDFYVIEAVRRANKQHDKVFRVNIISVGDL